MERSLSLRTALRLPGFLEGDRLRHLSGFALTGIVATTILGPMAFLAWKGLGLGLGEFFARMGELGLHRLALARLSYRPIRNTWWPRMPLWLRKSG